MVAKTCLILLLAIAGLLGYQSVYRDYAYRRDAIRERDQLLARMRTESKTYDAALDARNECYAKYPDVSVARVKCGMEDIATQTAIKSATAVDEIERLHRAVVARHGGLTPDWWIKP